MFLILLYDGEASKLGTVLRSQSESHINWLSVQWDNGIKDQYRMGAEGCYDLQLIGNL